MYVLTTQHFNRLIKLVVNINNLTYYWKPKPFRFTLWEILTQYNHLKIQWNMFRALTHTRNVSRKSIWNCVAKFE